MSLIFVNLRWNDPGQDRYEDVLRAIPQDRDLPPGCLSRQLRRQGGALMATETWDSDVASGRVNHLVLAMRTAGVEESPQVAMFSVPEMFAGPYRRQARAAAGEALAVPTAIPEQRGTPTEEELPERVASAASSAGVQTTTN